MGEGEVEREREREREREKEKEKERKRERMRKRKAHGTHILTLGISLEEGSGETSSLFMSTLTSGTSGI